MKFKSKYSFEDYRGSVINFLTVESVSEVRSKDGSVQWVFRCACGNAVVAPPARIMSGHNKSCGCMKYKTDAQLTKRSSNRPPMRISLEDYIGKKSHRLTVVGIERPEIKGRAKLVCVCDCGNTQSVYPYQFNRGDIQSCGCAKYGHSESHKGNTSRRTHNLSRNRFYRKWNAMVQRCHSPSASSYSRYGAKGITVCDEWRYSPEKFIEWCESTHPDGPLLSIDRIDGSKGYSPDNCRWLTLSEQQHNLRNNRWVTYNGERKCITALCSELSIPSASIYSRVKKGMTFEEAFEDFLNWRASKES